MYKILDLKRVFSTFQETVCSLLNALHDLAPSYVGNLIKQYKPCRSLRSSSKGLLAVPSSNLQTYGNRAFSIAAPKLWNSISTEVRTVDSLSQFKTFLKTQLFKVRFS